MYGDIVVTQNGYISRENVVRFHDGTEATGIYNERVLEAKEALDVMLTAASESDPS